MKIIEESEVRKMVREACKEHGSLRAFSAHLGVSAAFVSDIARGSREPSGKVLEYLGLKKEVRRVVIFFKADRAV